MYLKEQTKKLKKTYIIHKIGNMMNLVTNSYVQAITGYLSNNTLIESISININEISRYMKVIIVATTNYLIYVEKMQIRVQIKK